LGEAYLELARSILRVIDRERPRDTRDGVVSLARGVTDWLATSKGGIGVVPETRQILAGPGLVGGGDLSVDRTLSLDESGVVPDTYTLATVTVDIYGRILAAANGEVTAGHVSGLDPEQVLFGSPAGSIGQSPKLTWSESTETLWVGNIRPSPEATHPTIGIAGDGWPAIHAVVVAADRFWLPGPDSAYYTILETDLFGNVYLTSPHPDMSDAGEVLVRGNAFEVQREISEVAVTRLRVTSDGHVLPGANSTYDIGSSGLRWRKVYADEVIGAITPTGFTEGPVFFGGVGGALAQDSTFSYNPATDVLSVKQIHVQSPDTSIEAGGGVMSLRTTGGLFITVADSDNAFVVEDTDENVLLRCRDKIGGDGSVHITNNLRVGGTVTVGGLDGYYLTDSGSAARLVLSLYGAPNNLLVSAPHPDMSDASEVHIRGNAFEVQRKISGTPHTRLRITTDGHVLPGTHNAYDIGSSGLRWQAVYAGDLNTTSATVSGLTPGRVVFPASGGLLSGSANLFWDNASSWLVVTGQIGVGVASPLERLHIYGSGNSTRILIHGDQSQEQALVFADGAAASPTTRWTLRKLASTSTLAITEGASTDRWTMAVGGLVTHTGGTLATDGTQSWYLLTGTLPSATVSVQGWYLQVTGAGNAAGRQYAARIQLNAGYTGSSGTALLRGVNRSAGTGGAILETGSAPGVPLGNLGLTGGAEGNTSGANCGGWFYATGGGGNNDNAIRAAVVGQVLSVGTNEIAIGISGVATTTGSGGHSAIGVWAFLGTAEPSYVTNRSGGHVLAALVADNGDAPVDIAQFRDGGTVVLSVIDGGASQWKELTAPGTPPSGYARMYFKDNGAGKQQLAVKWDDGVETIIATQP
jgi:hypothetical protein